MQRDSERIARIEEQRRSNSKPLFKDTMIENLQHKIQTQYLNNRNHDPKKLNPKQEAIQRDKERIARTVEQALTPEP